MGEDVTPESTDGGPAEDEAVEAASPPEVDDEAEKAYLATDNQLGQ